MICNFLILIENNLRGYNLDQIENWEDVKCNLCGSNSLNKLFSGKDLVYKREGFFTVVKCENCGLMYTNPRPNQSIISNYYPDEYWEINEDYGDNESKLKHLAHQFINKISTKMDIPSEPDAKLLDIGCGDGKQLFKHKENGWITYGVEINDLAANFVREHYGLNVFTGTVEEAKFENDFFDVIILNNVLEHLFDPKTTLNEINRILKNNGTLVIGIPNANSFEAKIFKKYWSAWDLPRHLYHFTPNTIKSLLNKTGFQVLEIKFDNNPTVTLSSLRLIFEERKINPLLGLSFSYPFSHLMSVIFAKLGRSYGISVYSTKKKI